MMFANTLIHIVVKGNIGHNLFLRTIRRVNANCMRYFFSNCGNSVKPRSRIKFGTHNGNIRRERSQEPKSIRGNQNLFSANEPMNSDLFEFLGPFAGNFHLKYSCSLCVKCTWKCSLQLFPANSPLMCADLKP